MLKNIPDFDPEESAGAPPIQFFNDRKEILLNSTVTGAASSGENFDDEDPLETYIKLISQTGARRASFDTPVDAKLLMKPGRRGSVLRILTEGFET